MTITTPTELADSAAEAIRQINHATASSTVMFPDDVYGVVGALRALADRLPQAYDQLAAALAELEEAGHIRVAQANSGDSPARSVTDACRALKAAVLAAQDMGTALGAAHTAVSYLAYQD